MIIILAAILTIVGGSLYYHYSASSKVDISNYDNIKSALVLENNPQKQVLNALDKHDYRCLAIGGYVDLPFGAPMSLWTKYGFVVIDGTSDSSPLNFDRDYQKQARDYCERYNTYLTSEMAKRRIK